MTATSHPPTAMKQRCFTETAPDATIHCQIIDLGRQVYVWASVGANTKLNNLYMAIQTPAASTPSVATLLPASAASNEANAFAQRLAMRLKRPVLCSWNIPASEPLLQAIAEKRLLKELKEMLEST
ncbi:hypothetical protein DUNSADRAFT_6843 [Dunaliella salina]|uniref:Proteasome assembly chaperone 4 n=1 Tax=Dunaliella salina TaxID=3046 RepID=A0ABQ7GMH2_DUNSA|nr:hypothetical protein DUNSADRAFT_6843 [Dunaliella salina]|eukprot:KAF5835809.1 hypothetical protein DUNSADRAFT_6843 [Dunaliella salina]